MLNPKKFQVACMAFAIGLSALIFSGCGKSYPPEFGKSIKYLDSRVFYTTAVTEEEARKLGDYLLSSGFFQKGRPGSVQLNKEGDVYQFRMVIKEGLEKDTEFLKSAGIFVATLSRDVFAGKKVEAHLCDTQFKNLQVVAFEIKD